MWSAVGPLTALALGLILQPIVLRVMTAAAVIDMPCERSSHTTATPRGGGVAVGVAAAVGLMFDPSTRSFTVPLLLFACIGLAEDLRGVAISVRLGLQTIAAGVTGVILLPVADTTVGRALAVLAVTGWLVGYANVFNFMDGINGISAVHAILAGSVYMVLGVLHGIVALAIAGAAVAGASLSFLPWNGGRAKIFLGDVGSYGLGGVLGALAAYGVFNGVPVEAAAAPLAVYLADAGWTLAKRALRGEAWYLPHRMHIYQQLTDFGWSHQRVTAITALVSSTVCVFAVAAVLSGLVVRIALDAAAFAILVGYLASPLWLAVRERRRNTEDQRIYA